MRAQTPLHCVPLLPIDFPTIVCLCGSTRFYDAFMRANYEETMAGRIVLSVGFFRKELGRLGEEPIVEFHGERIGCTAEEKMKLDALHLKKIDLADEVLILNCGDYVGSSTSSELEYARARQKRIRWLQESKYAAPGEKVGVCSKAANNAASQRRTQEKSE